MSERKSTTIHIKIDNHAIQRNVLQQSKTHVRTTLVDSVCPGLRLVINKKSATYTYPYRKRGLTNEGKRHPQRWIILGSPQTLTPAEARLAADKIKAAVRNGEDPAIDKKNTEAELRLSQEKQKPLGLWARQYFDLLSKSEPTKYQQSEIFHINAAIHELGLEHKRPSDVTSQVFKNLISKHIDRPATSKHRFGAFSRFMDFLVEEEAIATNPAASISRRHRPKPPPPRQDFYDFEELAQLWNTTGLPRAYQLYLRFMIVVPLRRSVGAALLASQINWSRSEIRLSASDTKNSEPFVVPLNKLAKDLLLEASSEERQKVFQLSLNADGKMTSWKHFTNEVRKKSEVKHFKIHDLRRTFVTLIAENSEFSEALIDSILNHKQSVSRAGILGHYQHAKYTKRRREVMEAWEEILRNNNVIQ